MPYSLLCANLPQIFMSPLISEAHDIHLIPWRALCLLADCSGFPCPTEILHLHFTGTPLNQVVQRSL